MKTENPNQESSNQNKNIGPGDPAPEQENKRKIDLIDVITANTQINTIITLLERVDFRLVALMIQSTPDESKDSPNYKSLIATFEYFQQIVNIFKDAAPEPEDSVIIKPNF